MQITVKDYATPRLQQMLATIQNRRPLMAKLGKQLENSLRAHFAQRESQPNQKGWKKKHFWNREIRAQTALTSATENAAIVTISNPAIRLKIHGGTVRPTRTKYLAIPLCEEAYAAGNPRSAAIRDTFFWTNPKTKKLFIARRDGKTLKLLWLLKDTVTHAPDPDALPPSEPIAEALLKITTKHIQTKDGGTAGAALY